MKINEAIITLVEGKLAKPLIRLESPGDLIAHSQIFNGVIKAESPPWVIGCVIKSKGEIKVLGQMPPSPTSIISECVITDTVLPEGYYARSVIDSKRTEE